jgi:hypothetical protein
MSREEPLPIPFFVGRSRSGTTLLRAIFDSHPDLAIPPEAHFLVPMAKFRDRYERRDGFDVDRFCKDLSRQESFGWWHLDSTGLDRMMLTPPSSFTEAIRILYASYARKQGKVRYGDKTPDNAEHLMLINELFPEARFVHIIRDGRDVALSQIDHGFMAGLPHAAFFWGRLVRRARDAGERLGDGRYLEIRYEELVRDPVTVVSRVCTFLQLSFHPEMLRYFERADEILYPRMSHDENVRRPPTAGLRDWQTQMPPSDVAVFEVIAGDSLTAAGYQRVALKPGFTARARATLGLVRVYAWRTYARALKSIRSLSPFFAEIRRSRRQ